MAISSVGGFPAMLEGINTGPQYGRGCSKEGRQGCLVQHHG
ncbi:MAG: hypothetical protein AB8B44_04850 [Prochlorococcus sp.]